MRVARRPAGQDEARVPVVVTLARGHPAPTSHGPEQGVCRLSEAQLALLRTELDLGSAAPGWDDV